MRRQSKLNDVLHMGIAFFWFLATFLVGVGLSSNPAEAQPFAYVTNPRSAIISVIDTNPSSPHYNKVVSTITGPGIVKVPGPPHTQNGMSSPFVIAFTPDGTRAYVANIWSDTVSVIDTDPSSTDFNKVVSTIEVGGTPVFVAFTPDGARAYVTNGDSDTVSVIDTDPSSTDFNKVVSTITGLGMTPFVIAFTPDGARAYVTNGDSDTVSVIDTDPSSTDFNKVVSTIEVGGTPVFVAFTPDGARAYVTNENSDTVSVIDTDPASTNYNKVVSIIGAGPKPFGVTITPDGTRAYVTFFFYCTLTPECGSGVQVIDTETDTVIDTIEIVGISYILALTPDGTRGYLAPTNSPVGVIDTSDNTVVDTIKIEHGPNGPNGPYWVAIAPSVDTDSYAAAFETRRRKTPWQ